MIAKNSPIALADIYMRLSSEEAGHGESASITNQRTIIHQYCAAHNIGIVKEFVDDGFTGSNFNRPGFSAMIGHLATGEANMVITKDLSRLGRDMIESSNYAERVFPNMGLRYIAISDNFDSDEVNLMAPFQFAMNDVYLRDISRKIKQVLQSKRQKGEYCASAPFGYMKDPDDKTHLVPNPETAPIVQRVFRMAVSGETCHRIARILTDEMVTTPSRYKASISKNYTERGMAQVVDHWCHTTVKRMLTNEVYLGKTQLGKTKQVSIKSSKKMPIPKSQWYQFDDTHIPLVSQHDFEIVQHYMQIHAKNWREGDNVRHSVFNGVAFCECCGSAMCTAGTTYKGERMKYWFLYCNAQTRSSPIQCEHRARIRYHDLVQIVTEELRTILRLTSDDRDAIVRRACAKYKSSSIFADKRTVSDVESRIESIQKAISKAYIDNVSGRITDVILQTTVQRLTMEIQSAQQDLTALQNREKSIGGVKGQYAKFFQRVDRYTSIDTLTPEIVHTFIDRIEIGEAILPPGYQKRTHHTIPVQQSIKIYYKFVGETSFQTLSQANEHSDK